MDTPTVSLILTVIGDDRPGLVERLASAISRHDGNWLESSMSHLSGKVAGIVSIELPRRRLGRSKPSSLGSRDCASHRRYPNPRPSTSRMAASAD